MQKITFGGTEYVKASEVAKRFRYTSDYVGQLCRSKKVNARSVGRNWYVELDSVVEYRKSKHKTQKQTAKKQVQKSSVSHRVVKKVEPVTRAKTLRIAGSKAASVAEETQIVKPQYSTDDGILVPVLGVKSSLAKASKKKRSGVVIEPAKIKVIPVAKSKTTETQFKTEKLPEISLSGKLKIAEDDTDMDALIESDEQEMVSEMKPKDKQSVVKTAPKEGKKIDSSANVVGSKELISTDNRSNTENLPRKSAAKSNFSSSKSSFTPKSVSRKVAKRSKLFMTLAITLVFSSLFGGLLMSVGSEIVVVEGEYNNRLKFSLANLQQVVKIFE